MKTKGLPDNRMLDGIDVAYAFEVRVLEEVVIGKRTVDGHVYVPVDCCRQDQTTETLVVRGQVRTAPTKGYTQRRSRNDHDAGSSDRRATASSCHPNSEDSKL